MIRHQQDLIYYNPFLYCSIIIDIKENFIISCFYFSCLDVSQNTALTTLYCYVNQLSNLYITQNTALTNFRCHDNQLTSLDVSQNTALTYLSFSDNQLTSIDVSNNTALTNLQFHYNQITSLDVSNNTALEFLGCTQNQLTSLDVAQNTALTSLQCTKNQLTSLDVSHNTALTNLNCSFNQLVSLDARNGNNSNLIGFYATSNPSLNCINVDDAVWSTTNWLNIDSQHYFSINCPPPSAIQEHTTNKELLKVTDLFGRETKQTNQPLFYIYDDGTVEKRIVIE